MKLTHPNEELATRQQKWWLSTAVSPLDHFYYDLTHRGGLAFELEMDEIGDEILRDDTYALSRYTGRGDVWVDAGCHVGTFSLAALMADADVSVMVDLDPTMAWCADVNTRQFLCQLLVRDDGKTQRIRPTGWCEELRTATPLVEMGMQTRELWQGERGRRSCLKLDVQGAELGILEHGGAARLAEAYDLMVMEWHHGQPPLVLLENGGWHISQVKSHTDVLLNTDTCLIWAVSG